MTATGSPVSFYLDQHADPAIARALRRHGIACITAWEDRSNELPDELLLNRSTELGYVLYTEDRDFLRIAAQWLKEGRPFSGIVYARNQGLSIRTIIDNLLTIAGATDKSYWMNWLEYLPL